MSTPTPDIPPLVLRAMTLDDLDAVNTIEKQVYPTPFSQKGYQNELTKNELAHYFVLAGEGELGLVGYIGHWFMLDEGHISIISVDPKWQGKRFGELLLLWSLRQMVANQSAIATLEVRASNTRAQGLYLKYGFKIVGRRKRYYRDTGEDGLIMTVASLAGDYGARLEAAWDGVLEGISAEIIITTNSPE